VCPPSRSAESWERCVRTSFAKESMYRFSFALLIVATSFPCAIFAATLQINPTTTLSVQTSNNTSAANSFTSQSNGNLGSSNVSKLDVHSLLYPGANTKVLAHMMLWFGGTNHMNVGYNSADPAQVKKQIQDMIARGIDGVIIDWYGPNNPVDPATRVLMAEAEAHPGFSFAIMVDQGAIKQNMCSGCNAQQTLVQLLRYAEEQYFPSPAYLRIDGSPVVTNFDIDLFYKVDWAAAKATLATNPLFVFQNSGGFSHVITGGSYSWVIPTTTDYGLSYLTNFYTTGLGFPQEKTVGATYKGFNDSLAAWGTKRVMSQQCGQTWLQTFNKANAFYNSTKQLSLLQLVTWNDYEEGTEIESGIDNCLSISASLSGDSLTWKVTGHENTVDHYTPYISANGQNLMPLNDLAVGLHTLNLCSYSLAAGNYTLYVQAVGKASLKNQISGPVRYTPHCSTGTGTTKISLRASPSAATIAPGGSASTNITVTSDAGSFDAPISLSCSNLPAGMTCSFAPNELMPASTTGSSVLTISTASVSGVVRRPESRGEKMPIPASWFILGVAGLALFDAKKKRAGRTRVAGMLLSMAVLLSSCGGGGGGQSRSITPAVSVAPVSRTAYTIIINGISGGIQGSTTATITIQ
jgi:hypothetical protein